MSTSNLALVQGLRETRETLERWNAAPSAVLVPWLILSGAVAITLLLAVWAVATLSDPDPTPLGLPGVTHPAEAGDVVRVLFRNSLVLALHAMACVAGFIAGSSLPQTAERQRGLSRRVHEIAGPVAIAFVVCATLFSLTTQAYVLGGDASTLASQLRMTPAELIVGLLPHAIPELVALFLPLAAWTIASRRGEWHELLAATLATVAAAVPVLVTAALIEVYVSPRLVLSLAG